MMISSLLIGEDEHFHHRPPIIAAGRPASERLDQ
jgi:hypothetical protein